MDRDVRVGWSTASAFRSCCGSAKFAANTCHVTAGVQRGRRDWAAGRPAGDDSRAGAVVRYVVAERMGTILLSALVAHTAWHWAIDRGTTLMGYRFPEFTLQDMAAGIRLLMVILAAAGAVWLISSWMGRSSSEPSRALAPEPEPSARSASDPLTR
jgi:hypothetical protein